MARPNYQVVADALRADIQSGTIPAGKALPSTKDLRARFNCGAGAIREAILILTHEEVVVTAPGRGRYALRLPGPDDRPTPEENPSTTGTP